MGRSGLEAGPNTVNRRARVQAAPDLDHRLDSDRRLREDSCTAPPSAKGVAFASSTGSDDLPARSADDQQVLSGRYRSRRADACAAFLEPGCVPLQSEVGRSTCRYHLTLTPERLAGARARTLSTWSVRWGPQTRREGNR